MHYQAPPPPIVQEVEIAQRINPIDLGIKYAQHCGLIDPPIYYVRAASEIHKILHRQQTSNWETFTAILGEAPTTIDLEQMADRLRNSDVLIVLVCPSANPDATWSAFEELNTGEFRAMGYWLAEPYIFLLSPHIPF